MQLPSFLTPSRGSLKGKRCLSSPWEEAGLPKAQTWQNVPQLQPPPRPAAGQPASPVSPGFPFSWVLLSSAQPVILLQFLSTADRHILVSWAHEVTVTL